MRIAEFFLADTTRVTWMNGKSYMLWIVDLVAGRPRRTNKTEETVAHAAC